MRSLSCFVLLSFVSSALGAGFASHNIAARRATEFEYFAPTSDPKSFYGLATARTDALQAGAPYPDYLYTCGDEHDAGEEAHWSPFQMAAADYIRSKYPNWANEGRDGDGAGLVAFMLGVTSHYIVDINWHGLEVIPSGEGLIRTMGYADFNCTDGDLCSVAHSAADTGGEFSAAASMNISWYPTSHWFIPVNDLVNIYAIMNETNQGPLVKPQWIEECAVVFYVGSWAESKFGALIYPLMASRLGALLLENYYDFPVGGIDDDAAWTGFMWDRFADWVVNGPPPTPPPRKLTEAAAASLKKPVSSLKRLWAQSIKELLKREDSVFGSWSERPDGTKSSSGKFVGVRSGSNAPSTQEQTTFLRQLVDKMIDTYILPLAGLTSADDFVVMQAKHDLYARIDEIVSGTDVTVDVAITRPNISLASVVRGGFASHQYLASSLTTARLTATSQKCTEDLLVGSIGAGRAGGPQEGIVEIVFGECNKPGPAAGEETVQVLRGGSAAGTPASSFPSYERFGWSTASVDVNQDSQMDVVACAPSFGGGRDVQLAKGNYSGRCDIFLGPFPKSKASQERTADFSIYGDKEWGNFGYVITAGDVDGDGSKDLIVSAPFAGSYPTISANDRGDLSSQGAVYVFLSKSFPKTFGRTSKKSMDASVAADFTLQPQASFQWFGRALSVLPSVDSAPLLLVGAPTFHSLQPGDENSAVGRVSAYSFGASPEVAWTITGCAHAGRTGQAVASSPSGDFIAISEPAFNATRRFSKTEKSILRSGRLAIISTAALTAAVSTSGRKDFNLCELSSLLPSESDLKFVDGDSFEGRFGSSLLFSETHEALELLVTAPLADYGAGRIHVVDAKRSGRVVRTVSGKDLFGRHAKGRLGHGGVVVRTHNENPAKKFEVLIGSPHANSLDGTEQSGALISLV